MTSVILADDQDLVRSGLRALLQARGVEVLGEAPHGRAAVELARSCRPDVLVMDIRMPVMDGIAATRAVVAADLPGISTVKTHVNRVLTELGAGSRAQAVVTAYETGLVRPGDPL